MQLHPRACFCHGTAYSRLMRVKFKTYRTMFTSMFLCCVCQTTGFGVCMCVCVCVCVCVCLDVLYQIICEWRWNEAASSLIGINRMLVSGEKTWDHHHSIHWIMFRCILFLIKYSDARHSSFLQTVILLSVFSFFFSFFFFSLRSIKVKKNTSTYRVCSGLYCYCYFFQ